jgi:hypothetical protein
MTYSAEYGRRAAKSAEHEYEWRMEQRLERLAVANGQPATDKQMAYFKKLSATRVTTATGPDGTWQEAVERVLGKMNADAAYRPNVRWTRLAISALSGEQSAPKVAAPAVAAPRADEEATPKQKGFIKSLVAKRDVPADVMAQVEAALLSKAKASQLIGLLTTLPVKQNA